MARIGLANRIRRLETQRKFARAFGQVLIYRPGQPVGKPSQSGRYMQVPNFGSDAEWELAAAKQQHLLTSQAKEKH